MEEKRTASPNKKKCKKHAEQKKISHFFSQSISNGKSVENSQNILSKNNLNKKRKEKIDLETNEDTKPNLKMRKTQNSESKSNSNSAFENERKYDYLFDDIDFSGDPFLEDENTSQKTTKDSRNTESNISSSPRKALQSINDMTKGLKSPASKFSKNQNGQNVNNTKASPNCKSLQETKREKKNENGFVLSKSDSSIRKDLETTYFHDVEDIQDLFDDDWYGNNEEGIDLSSFKRCKVATFEVFLYETLLTVTEIDSGAVAIVRCRDFWRMVHFEKNQIATIKAKRESEQWIIDNSFGFFVSEPDILLSGTSVVGGTFCQRRSILKEIFRDIESLPHYEPNALALLTGTLSHELLQDALQNKIYALAGIRKMFEEKMRSQQVIDKLYANNLSSKDFRKHTEPYIQHIFDFIEYYIKGKNVQAKDKKMKCKIEEVQDIEENIWLPKLGLKGKVDITTMVNINSRKKIMPLEVKTGRVTFSPEHKGQIILYTLMMNLTGRDVDSGLLLYLKENIMKEVTGSHHELRDLIILRNKLAYYLTRKSKIYEKRNENGDLKSTIELPEPISHPGCDKCTLKNLCCVYLSKDDSVLLNEKHPLKSISESIFKYLTEKHIDYVMKWANLLQLEEVANNSEFTLSDVWNVDPEHREKREVCMSNMKVVGEVTKRTIRFIHTFTRQDRSEDLKRKKLDLLDFRENEYVIVSTDERINLAAGTISKLESDTVTINLNRNLTLLYPNYKFHIDKYGDSNIIGFNNYGNIGGLLDNHPNCARLRRIVIDKEPATFMKFVPRQIIQKGEGIIDNLNDYQKAAIKKSLIANDYVLIKGMPGTGKTQTVVALIELLVRLGSSVLITAHTNSAVDNILLKLMKRDIDFLRLGSIERMRPELKDKSEQSLTKNCTTPEDYNVVYCEKKIVGITCYGASHIIFQKRRFDYCIVDESTQVLQATVLRPLYSAAKFVLVGDPDQLPPVVKSTEARKFGMGVSLFERLNSENNSVTLRVQYRMNSRIMDVANKLTYGNKLIAANETIANATLNFQHNSVIESCERWVKDALSTKLEDSCIMLDTMATHQLENSTSMHNCNAYEVAIILRLTNVLREAGIAAANIGIMSPYKAQVTRLKKTLPADIEVNTVDQYQGRDKDVILYSCTKSTNLSYQVKEFHILEDHKRLTVAVTRAKHKLIVVGDKKCLDLYSPFNKLFKSMKNEHVMILEDGQNDFSWKDLEKLVEL